MTISWFQLTARQPTNIVVPVILMSALCMVICVTGNDPVKSASIILSLFEAVTNMQLYVFNYSFMQ